MIERTINGIVYFAVHPFPQYAKLYVTPPGETEFFTGQTVEAEPGTNYGPFSYVVNALGTWTFRAEAISGSTVGGSGTQSIVISAITAPKPDPLILTSPMDGMITGVFDFGTSTAQQWARVYYRTSSIDWIAVAGRVEPDENGQGNFQISGLSEGTYEVKVVSENDDGIGTSSDIESIDVESGTGLDAIARASAAKAHQLAQIAAGIAQEARALVSASSDPVDDTARAAASTAQQLAQIAVGMAQEARASGGTTSSTGITILETQVFS